MSKGLNLKSQQENSQKGGLDKKEALSVTKQDHQISTNVTMFENRFKKMRLSKLEKEVEELNADNEYIKDIVKAYTRNREKMYPYLYWAVYAVYQIEKVIKVRFNLLGRIVKRTKKIDSESKPKNKDR